jgi:hypothetical protein
MPTAHSSEERRNEKYRATISGLVGIGAKDEIEGMIASQLLAAHHAAVECYRRAMLSEQTFEGRRENLTQANKLSRTYAGLARRLKSSPRERATKSHGRARPCPRRRPGHRGQRREPGGRDHTEIRGTTPMHLPMHRAPRCRARTRRGSLCQSPAMPNGRCRKHGRTSPGAPKGNRNALKHGRYTAHAISRRREIAAAYSQRAAVNAFLTNEHMRSSLGRDGSDAALGGARSSCPKLPRKGSLTSLFSSPMLLSGNSNCASV